MNRYFRYLLVLTSLVLVMFTIGFLLQIPLFTSLWPLPYTSSMSFIFIASIAAAAAASILWCVAANEQAAIAGVALDFVTIFIPISILVFQLAGHSASNTLTVFGVSCIVTAVFGLGLLIWSLRSPAHDSRPVPQLVRGTFAFFIIALIIVGGQMILKNTDILPWKTSTDTTVIYGWMFLGAAAYFAYGLVRPGWYNAGGQLAGFLAYDVILIVPFLQRLPTIAPGLRVNLIVYIMVLSFSGLLAIYYLFIHRATRVWVTAKQAAV